MQRVVLNGHKPNWVVVRSGVPKGSVLGPLLFLIFVNDMENGVGGKLFKFADDTKLVRAIRGLGDNVAMQRDLDKLLGWVDVNNVI